MSLYEFEVTTIRGEEETLAPYRGQVLLIVNTATKCGFTPQLTGLQKLYDRYREKGFAVLGFPCGQFLNQELNDNSEIAETCQLNYGVTFPMFAKIDVNGPNAHPLFRYLTQEAKGAFGTKAIKWNFTKFLVDRDGRVVKRYAPTDKPEQLEGRIAELVENRTG
ncbi:glutathione peroxidase homolog BsaA [Paenibacillus sp. J31TS4]|uniref:glutathione peroxidase n=1 Tax=Paenibacillus sp. J31TS4 TaxID=2807195 RepID=UPI001B21423F|nr:glutathione peroxidase [Paenibacillus sp. J31TS4]GIP40477.1 glutathione peroxidase homolog BsaA [Paenibacillus sp. J31TS4]